MRRGSAALLVTGLFVAGLLTGCAPATDDGGPDLPKIGEAKIDVDTPTLRQLKSQAGIENCAPGKASNDLPAITLPCFGGGPDVALNTLQGPLVVSTWASWCGPCQRELPYYQKLATAYAGRVSVIGIDYTDPQTEGAMDLLVETGATFPQLADPQSALAAKSPFPRMNNLPVLLLVDGGGKVAHVELGQITSYDELADLVEEHLGVTA
jgi:thiol-disulfide isomerase/thioredoxin